MLSANEIRTSFIDFFKARSHQFVPSSPVVPIGDDTLLFANAGMNQFKDVFLGTGARPYNRAANSQKCIRAGGKHNDLEDVGTDTYHHTFFEMLGNWSLGDYFKAEAIEWAWELLTKVWEIDPERLHVTYFQGDEQDNLVSDTESRDLWRRFLPDERIHKGNKKDNFWEMGDTGPCGPCSEIHYDGTADNSGAKLINADNPDVIEIWNLVFIQYNRDQCGKLTLLPARHVDTGLGLERVTRIIQNKSSNYDTDVFIPIINAISDIAGVKYTAKTNCQTDIAFRVVADHLRALTFAITDGGVPSNEGRGYVLRRILRRASRFGRVLDMHEPFIYKLVDTVVGLMGDAFGELGQRSDFVKTVIESEEVSFGRTLDRGLEIFKTAAAKAKKTKTIIGEDAFQLYDTFGFPLDLTQLMAREQNLTVDTAGFDNLMEQQKQRARAAQKTSTLASFVTDTALPATDDSAKYETDSCTTRVLGWIDSKGFETAGQLTEQNNDVALVLEKTCFYAESGGQMGDAGIIGGAGWKFNVENTEKIADCVIHKGKLIAGKISVGDEALVTVSKDRLSSRKNHTATHILQWALQQSLGDSVAQQGSLVCPEYLRFDFTCPKALTSEQQKKVEDLVNEKIAQDLPLTSIVLPVAEAKKLGAMALFGEKYGDKVRVIAIGAPDAENLNKA
ncbi:MAG: alanine--tRNA ligase, partial [Planctomycetes bacterium]|nr:alanine--tRNA ligase [Planctomycetota bacterium]